MAQIIINLHIKSVHSCIDGRAHSALPNTVVFFFEGNCSFLLKAIDVDYTACIQKSVRITLLDDRYTMYFFRADSLRDTQFFDCS